MIAWGVKQKDASNDTMRIVSNMAKAHVLIMENPALSIYKLRIDTDGEINVLDGPLIVVTEGGNLYGLPTVKRFAVKAIIAAIIMMASIILLFVFDNWIFGVSWLISTVVALTSAKQTAQKLDSRALYIRKFLADLRRELGD